MHSFSFLHQGHAEDVVLWHRYNYYVLGCALIPDLAYDALERMVRVHWPVSVCDTVGSGDAKDYPSWVREQRRPTERERVDRDRAIAHRWMENL